MKTYHLRGKERREAKVLIKRVRAMLKEKYIAFYTPIPNYPLGSVQPEGEHLMGKTTALNLSANQNKEK